MEAPTSRNTHSFISQTISYIESKDGLKQEGIFYMIGDIETAKEISQLYNEESPDVLEIFSVDIFTACEVLKLLLIELNEPLCTCKYYYTFLNIFNIEDSTQRLRQLRILLYGLPHTNTSTILRILQFLQKISQNNKIGASQLAAIFSPYFLRPSPKFGENFHESFETEKLLEVMIDNAGFLAKINRISGQNSSSSISPRKREISGHFLVAKSLVDFKGDEKHVISFKKGENIILLDVKNGEGWFKGEIRGKVGYFPESSVEISPDSPVLLDPRAIAQVDKERRRIAENILAYEEKYINKLSIIFQNFIDPMRKMTQKREGIISDDDILNIFLNLDLMLVSHRNFTEKICERLRNWEEFPFLADIFDEAGKFTFMYKYYVNNFNSSAESLQICRSRNADFENFVKKLDYSEKLRGRSLEYYLCFPLRYVTDFSNLQKELVDATPHLHEDFDILNKHLTVLQNLSQSIDKTLAAAEHLNNTKNISELIFDVPEKMQLVQSHRLFLEEGILLKDKKKVYAFLFSDLLLYTKQIHGKYHKYLGHIDLHTSDLHTNESNVIKIINFEGVQRFTAENNKDFDKWFTVFNDIFGKFQDMNGNKKHTLEIQKMQREKTEFRRFRVAQELFVSEEEYSQNLTCIVTNFITIMRASLETKTPLLPLRNFVDIASNLENLASCHSSLLQVLRQRLIDWSETPQISDIFLEKVGLLEIMYKYYVSNYDTSLHAVDDCYQKSPIFANFIKEREAKDEVDFKYLLTRPLSRISNYYLFLLEMQQFTKKSHPAYENLNILVQILKKTSEDLNNDLQNSPQKECSPKGERRSKTWSKGLSFRKLRRGGKARSISIF